MPRLPGVAESDRGGPRELVSEQVAIPSRQSGSPKAEFVATSDAATRRQPVRPEHSHDRAFESEREGADGGVAPSTIPRGSATVMEASLDLAVPVTEEGTADGSATEPREASEARSIANAREAGPELAATTVFDSDSVRVAEMVATGTRAGPNRATESRPLSSAAAERNADENVSVATALSRDATQHQAAPSDRERGTVPESDAAVPSSRSAQARSRPPDFFQTAQAHIVGENPSGRQGPDPQEAPAAYNAFARSRPSGAVGSTRTSEAAPLQERNDDAPITDRAAEPELRHAAEVRKPAAQNVTEPPYNLPVMSRRQSLEQRPSRVQPASARPEAEGIHIGTLDIRIEAPKQRLQPPSRQPVSFRGSGTASRLYLRRD
jgi:hypothetical protein